VCRHGTLYFSLEGKYDGEYNFRKAVDKNSEFIDLEENMEAGKIKETGKI